MNNFCIALCFFSTTKLLRDSNKNFRAFILWMKNLTSMFLFTPSVGVEHFLVDLDGRNVFAPTPSVGVVHMRMVCT